MNGIGTSCPACGSEGLLPLLDMGRAPVMCGVTWADEGAARSSPAGSMKLAYCRACAHACNTGFEAQLLTYDEDYDNSLYHSAVFRAYSRELSRHLADEYDLRGKHVLEVGSGKGDFLVDLCRTADCRGTGYDESYDGRFSDERVSFVRDHAGWDRTSDFDFFVTRHVVEHLVDPYELLTQLRSACEGRSVQGYIEVPDAIYDFARSGWDCIYPHVSYFSATSLGRLADRAGFAVLSLVRRFEDQFLGLEVGVNTGMTDVRNVEGMGLRREREILETFKERHPTVVAAWRSRLSDVGFERCALWGAGAKGVSFLNAVDPAGRLGAVVDLNPSKQSRCLPVSGHRVVAPEGLRGRDIACVLITNPAYREEIAAALVALGVEADIWCA